jgi:hypothetical protein
MSYYLMIHTQDVENYGAHDWNGVGVCPQCWKYKGGITLAIPIKGAELTSRDANYAARSIDCLAEHDVLTNGNYFKTYYVGHEVVESRDLYIGQEYNEVGPDDPRYQFFDLVQFPHLSDDTNRFVRFCWLKKGERPSAF